MIEHDVISKGVVAAYSEEIRGKVMGTLPKMGHRITVEGTCEDAVKIYEQENLDFLFLGPICAGEVTFPFPNNTIVFLGRQKKDFDDKKVIEYYEKGAAYVAVEPVNMFELEARMRQMIKRRRGELLTGASMAVSDVWYYVNEPLNPAV